MTISCDIGGAGLSSINVFPRTDSNISEVEFIDFSGNDEKRDLDKKPLSFVNAEDNQGGKQNKTEESLFFATKYRVKVKLKSPNEMFEKMKEEKLRVKTTLR